MKTTEIKRLEKENQQLRAEAEYYKNIAATAGEYRLGDVSQLSDVISQLNKTKVKLEQERKAAESANKAKSDFLATMSHEMRTPLNGILGYANIGRKKFGKAPRQRLGEYFSLIHESGDRLFTFLSDLLDLAILDAEKANYNFQLYNLNLSVVTIINEVQLKLQEKNISVSFHDKQPHTVQFDRHKIIQVLHNLIDNAVKFSQQGTTISITIEEVDIEGATFQLIRIKDRGIGIPETELETIFDKFKQSSKTKTGAGGTGLGLAICRGILEAHS